LGISFEARDRLYVLRHMNKQEKTDLVTSQQHELTAIYGLWWLVIF